MPTYDLDELKSELTRDEGKRKFPYEDTEGILTIGIGWNLKANGLPDEVIETLLEIGIGDAERVMDGVYPDWRNLGDARQRVVVNMAFNLGNRLKGFTKMWVAIKAGDFAKARVEMLDSKWAVQVGVRSQRLAIMMEDG